MRAFAITGIVTASWISSIFDGSAMRATPPSRADVGRDALERHHGGGAGGLGDPRLLGGDHVHDHAALEHLGEAGLDAECGLSVTGPMLSTRLRRGRARLARAAWAVRRGGAARDSIRRSALRCSQREHAAPT